MCLITEHAHTLKRLKGAEDEIRALKAQLPSTGERPSPSDLFITPPLLWGDGVYNVTSYNFSIGAGWIARLKKESVSIPFTKDPILYVYPIPDTGSMDPLFDAGHNVFYLAGYDAADMPVLVEWLHERWLAVPPEANIVVYNIPGAMYAVHRIDEVSTDGTGRLWWFKGDNNRVRDPYPARDEHITMILAGILY